MTPLLFLTCIFAAATLWSLICVWACLQEAGQADQRLNDFAAGGKANLKSAPSAAFSASLSARRRNNGQDHELGKWLAWHLAQENQKQKRRNP